MADDMKAHLWDDEKFRAYVEGTGEINALLDVMEFKWTLTDQIKDRRERGNMDEDWAARITTVVIRCQTRITELKRSLRRQGKANEMNAALDDLREDRLEDA